MAMDAGDAACTSGLAKELRDALLADTATHAADNAALKAFCYRVAVTVVGHIAAHAEVAPGSMNVPGAGAVVGTGTVA